jgi:hypothetical protein
MVFDGVDPDHHDGKGQKHEPEETRNRFFISFAIMGVYYLNRMVTGGKWPPAPYSN